MHEKALDEAAKVRMFHRDLSEVATSFSLRFSARYMHPKFALLARIGLTATTSVPLRKLCARQVVRGVQPEYDESGDIVVVKTGTLKNGFLDYSEAQMVSEDFFEAVSNRAALRRGDILVASTGFGSLGKIDVFDSDNRAVADGHISIVRIRPVELPSSYVAHLMRHRFVQWQIEQGLTGSTNQTDIYPEQIESLRLPRLAYPWHVWAASESTRFFPIVARFSDFPAQSARYQS